MTLRAVPDTHWERLLAQAKADFERGDSSAGWANVAHAAFVEERPDAETRLRLVREVLGVGWHPEDAA